MMEIFRISNEKYANNLSSSGTANRWNLQGQNVIYAGSSRSLSTLETIVHKAAVKLNVRYKVMVIFVADDDYLTKQIKIAELPSYWRSMTSYSILQKIGSAWYEEQESLMLQVPSVVIPYEYNFVINSEHPDFEDCVKLVRTEEYFWDKRIV